MNIKIVCVGKLKENYWTQAVQEYLKRIGRFAKIEVAELKETRISDRPSKAEEEAVKKSEGEEILKKIKKDDYCITLEIKGKQLSSEQFAEKFSELALAGKGFSADTEKAFKNSGNNLNYDLIDETEKITVSEEELNQFIKEGNLFGGEQ